MEFSVLSHVSSAECSGTAPAYADRAFDQDAAKCRSSNPSLASRPQGPDLLLDSCPSYGTDPIPNQKFRGSGHSLSAVLRFLFWQWKQPELNGCVLLPTKTSMSMKHFSAVLALCLCTATAIAQTPPAAVQWTVILPYGSSLDTPARISVDQGITYWMLEDDIPHWTIGDGVIRRYDPDGLPLDGAYPNTTSIGCSGTLDRPIDLFVRNDSIWGIAYWRQLGGGILFCAQGPSGTWVPDNTINGYELADGVSSMLVTADRRYLCAWHEVSHDVRDGRVVAMDLANNVIWDVQLPTPAYGAIHALAVMGDSVAVASFPDLYWLDASTGALLSTTTLYSGGSGHGSVLSNNGSLYWAASVSGMVHYGKLDATGASLWSGTASGSTVNAIAVDDQDRLWIGGNGSSEGRLIKVEADGTYEGSYSTGETITDLDFTNGRLSLTGKWTANDPSSYLINTIPEP